MSGIRRGGVLTDVRAYRYEYERGQSVAGRASAGGGVHILETEIWLECEQSCTCTLCVACDAQEQFRYKIDLDFGAKINLYMLYIYQGTIQDGHRQS